MYYNFIIAAFCVRIIYFFYNDAWNVLSWSSRAHVQREHETTKSQLLYRTKSQQRANLIPSSSDGIQYSSFYYSVRRVIDPIEMNREYYHNYQLPPDHQIKILTVQNIGDEYHELLCTYNGFKIEKYRLL